jgi:hypothetical protein
LVLGRVISFAQARSSAEAERAKEQLKRTLEREPIRKQRASKDHTPLLKVVKVDRKPALESASS